MVKGNPKSSASSSTRKKHAKKALGTPDQPDTPIREKKPKAKEKGKGKSGSSKKEPRVKMYIPPTKPAPVQPDPLDSMGIAHRLPPDLLVVLRSLGKKAEVTKVRALEDLQANWVDRCDDEAVLYVVTDMLPVWLHHIPTLFVHPSRRIRLLGASIHAAFLNITSLRDHISLFLADSAPHQLESILGTWCIAAHDVDRTVALNASKSWNAFISRSGRPPAALTLTFEFCQRMVLDPLGTYVYLNPPQPAAAPPSAPHSRAKAASRHGHGSGHQTPVRQRDDPDAAPRDRDDEHEEAEIDRKARLRVGAFGAIGSLLTRCVEEEFEGVDKRGHVLLANPALWTALFHESSCSVCPTIEAFGEAQPPVRKAAWGLVDALLRLRTQTQGKIDYIRSPPTSSSNSSREGGEQAEGGEGKGDVLSVMSAALLRAAWTEPDPGVRTAMWSPLLGFLRAFPEAWELEARFATTSTTVTAGEGDTMGMGEGSGDEGEEEEEEGEPPPPLPPIPKPSAQSDSPPPSAGYLSFLRFIERGCAGAPVQGYPAVLVVFATVPLSIMASSSPSPLGAVIAAFWGAVESRALSGMQRGAALAAGAAFLESLLECVVFLGKRVHGEGKEGERALLLGTAASTLPTASTSALATVSTSTTTTDAPTSMVHAPIPETTTEDETRLSTLIAAQFVRALREIAAGNLKVDPRRAGAALARGFGRLRGIDEGWYARAWTGFAEAVGEYFLFGGGGEEVGDRGSRGTVLVDVLKGVYDASDRTNGEDARRLIIATVERCVAGATLELGGSGEIQTSDGMKTGCVAALLALLDAFGAGLWALDEGIVARLDGLVNEEIGPLVERAPEVLLAYLMGCPDEGRKMEVWGKILGRVCQQSPEEGEKKTEELLKLLRPWIDAAKRGALPASLRHPTASTTGAVDGLVARILGDALQGRVTDAVSEVLVEVFAASDYFVTKEGVQGAIGAVTSFITAEVDEVLRDREATLRPLVLPLRVLDAILKTHSKYMLLEKTLGVSLAPSLAVFAYLLPLCCAVNPGERKLAADIYGILVGSDDDVKERTAALVVERLRALLADPDARPSYEHILAVIKAGIPGMAIDFMRDAAPSRVELDAQLDQLEANPPHASLAVIDPLVPPESSFEAADADARAPAATPRSYAAIVSAILKHHLDNPRLLSHPTHLWTIRHFVALSIYASDLLGIPYAASKSGVFGGGAAASGVLAEVVKDVEAAMKVIFENDEPRGWRRLVLEAVQANKVDTLDGLPRFVAEMITLSTEKETIRESRVLYRVLQRVLDDGISSEEVDLWVGVARKLEKLALLTSLALTKAVSSIGVDSPRLDRYRNELAASITGVPPSKASTAGLALLRKLIAAAPPADSDVVFLPQHRAVNLVKACQHWATSDDEDIGEDVECAMTEVFVHVAPILQNVPGAHWEFIFDVVESNVETCSVGDASTLATLWATVRLISAIEDLSSTNRALRGVWQLRRTPVFKALRDMVTRRLPIESASVPRSVCLEALLTLLQELPDALIDSDTFAHMCPLLTDPATGVQKAAYALLQKAAQKHTERLVIEAGVDADAPVQGALPDELIEVLRMDDLGVDVDVDVGMDGHSSRVFAHLLGWMVLFDLFVDASLKVRSAYVEQLRALGLVATPFIPHILDILRLTEGVVGRAVKLDVWAVDEFYVQYYDARAPFSLPLLAAHLYFRALLTIPSLVYAWVLDCKDRQLSSSISAYTSSYFSPPLIRAELAHVRECAPGLADDAFAIKVTVSGGISGGSGGEVAAVYTVDEQALEVRIRIPGEWPLRRIEVRDHRSVGVDERRWRAWILGIQQTLWALNGHVIDGLSVFKKNVALHFEGQVECAICYSIINVTDGSLPKKPCNTCKNRFHAGCLYKWFSSSHSSSCPLCRSDII